MNVRAFLWRAASASLGLVCLCLPRIAAGQELELVREIGVAEGAADYTFFRISDLALGPDGELLVLDGGSKSIAVYDSTGTFSRRFGREGGGPGEFEAANRIRVVGDEVVVFDWRQSRITRFSLEGAVLKTEPLPRPSDLHLSQTYPMADGSVVGVSTFRASLGSPHHEPFVRVLRLIDARVDTLLTMDPGIALWRAPEGLPWGVIPDPLGSTGAFAVAGDSMVALVDATTSELQVVEVGRNGWRSLRPVTIPIEARDVRAEKLEQLEERLRARPSGAPARIELIPPTAFSDLTGRSFFDDKGSVWVETKSAEDNPRRWMVIARSPGQSRWISVPPNFSMMKVAGDLAYGVWRDEFDVQTVRVYRLR